MAIVYGFSIYRATRRPADERHLLHGVSYLDGHVSQPWNTSAE